MHQFKQFKPSFLSAGAIYGLAGAVLFGSNAPLAKLFLDHVEPLMLAGIMWAGGGLGLLPIYGWRSYTGQITNRIQSQDFWLLSISILIGGVLSSLFLMLGVNSTSAGMAALLLNFEGVFTTLLAWTVFRETWRSRIFLGIVIITAGGILLSYHGATDAGLSWGALAILGTCLCWAIDSNLVKGLTRRDPIQLAMLKSGVAGVINLLLALLLGQTLPPISILLAALLAGAVVYGLTMFCFVMVLRHLGAARTGAYFALSPFIGATIAILALGEDITVTFAIASTLMLVGVGFCLSESGSA